MVAKEFKVTLMGHTEYPVENLYAIWEASRNDEPLLTKTKSDWLGDTHHLRMVYYNEPDTLTTAETLKVEIINSTVLKILQMQIPIASMVGFTFMIENMSVAFREQLVRHAKFMDFWMQSMRIRNLAKFSAQELYLMPEPIKANKDLFHNYEKVMLEVSLFYNRAVDAGVPMEDARMVMPQATLHRGSCNPNLRSLVQMMKERSCQILQLSLWRPFLLQVSQILRDIDPLFTSLTQPPCIKDGCYNKCVYVHDNERRLEGKDAPLPCTLWLGRDRSDYETQAMATLNSKEFKSRLEDYESLWDKDSMFWENKNSHGDLHEN